MAGLEAVKWADSGAVKCTHVLYILTVTVQLLRDHKFVMEETDRCRQPRTKQMIKPSLKMVFAKN